MFLYFYVFMCLCFYAFMLLYFYVFMFLQFFDFFYVCVPYRNHSVSKVIIFLYVGYNMCDIFSARTAYDIERLRIKRKRKRFKFQLKLGIMKLEDKEHEEPRKKAHTRPTSNNSRYMPPKVTEKTKKCKRK